ncbi:MAG: FtsL-like putative cell division protein [Chitinophagales bacterium]|nr:hypothetical protein [Bacteroidota bacterium]
MRTPQKKASKNTVWKKFQQFFNLPDKVIDKILIRDNFKIAVLIMLLFGLYAYNKHSFNARRLYKKRLHEKIEELRAEYIELNTQLSIQSTQSSLEKKVSSKGLHELKEPIVVLKK